MQEQLPTAAWMHSVERSRTPEPRTMQEQLPTTAWMQEVRAHGWAKVEQCRSNCREQCRSNCRGKHSLFVCGALVYALTGV